MDISQLSRIEDSDLYFALSILCFALNSPICGSVALGVSIYCAILVNTMTHRLWKNRKSDDRIDDGDGIDADEKDRKNMEILSKW